VLPGGTANLWAHELGVAGSPERAARAIVTGQDRAMDMGRLWHGERSVRFMMIAGIGADGLMLERTDPRLKRAVGPAAIAVGIALVLPGLRPVEAIVRVEGCVAWEGPLAQAIVSNSRLYADVVRPAPEAAVDDGILDVTLVPFTGALALARAAVRLARWREPGAALPRFRGTNVEVECAEPLALEVDGSPVRRPSQGRTTYRLTVERDILQVRIPRSYRGSLFGAPSPDARHLAASA